MEYDGTPATAFEYSGDNHKLPVVEAVPVNKALLSMEMNAAMKTTGRTQLQVCSS